MQHVTSFHSSTVDADRLNAVVAELLAVEQARAFRRLLLERLSLLALLGGVVAAAWLSVL